MLLGMWPDTSPLLYNNLQWHFNGHCCVVDTGLTSALLMSFFWMLFCPPPEDALSKMAPLCLIQWVNQTEKGRFIGFFFHENIMQMLIITTCDSITDFHAKCASIPPTLFTRNSPQQNLVSFSQDTMVTTLGGCNLFIQKNSDDVDDDDEALSVLSLWYWIVCPTAESYFRWKDCDRCKTQLKCQFRLPVWL